MSGGTILAVDLGTSHTVAVIQRAGRPPESLLFDGSPLLPSGVFADRAGGLHTGQDGARLARAEPQRFEPHPKRHIDDGTELLGDREVGVPDLLAAVLRRVLDEAGNAGFRPGDQVVLTCPADWGRRRREILIEGARRAGITAPRVVEEPVAAAAYCAGVLGAGGHGRPLLVFDFGGGTLDLALVLLGPGAPQVLAVGGLADLGGLDVDAALAGHLGQVVAGEHPQLWQRLERPAGPADRQDRAAFWAEVRGAKEMLSRSASAPVMLPGVNRSLHLTREELDQLAGPLVERAVDEAHRVLAGAGVHPSQLGGVLLVGGSSRIPLVATRLHARFGIAPTVPEQPELPVARGALLTAAPLPARTPQTTTMTGAAMPVSGIPVSSLPVSAPPVPAAPVSAPPTPADAPPTPVHRSSRTPLVAVVSIIAVLVLVGGFALVGWFIYRNAQLSGRTGEVGSATPSGPPTGYKACGSVFCAIQPDCEQELNVDVDCRDPHQRQEFAAGWLSTLRETDNKPEFERACNKAVLKARSIDPNATANWKIDSTWGQTDGHYMLHCFAGPASGTTTGDAFKTG